MLLAVLAILISQVWFGFRLLASEMIFLPSLGAYDAIFPQNRTV